MCFQTATGAINWFSHVSDTANDLTTVDGDLSPDGALFYSLAIRDTGSSKKPMVITFKVLDGTRVGFSYFGSGSINPGAILATQTNRLLVAATIDKTGSFAKSSSNDDILISNWGYLLSDQTCSAFNFVTTMPGTMTTSLIATASLLA